jgi:hypothetical protein
MLHTYNLYALCAVYITRNLIKVYSFLQHLRSMSSMSVRQMLVQMLALHPS